MEPTWQDLSLRVISVRTMRTVELLNLLEEVRKFRWFSRVPLIKEGTSLTKNPKTKPAVALKMGRLKHRNLL